MSNSRSNRARSSRAQSRSSSTRSRSSRAQSRSSSTRSRSSRAQSRSSSTRSRSSKAKSVSKSRNKSKARKLRKSLSKLQSGGIRPKLSSLLGILGKGKRKKNKVTTSGTKQPPSLIPTRRFRPISLNRSPVQILKLQDGLGTSTTNASPSQVSKKISGLSGTSSSNYPRARMTQLQGMTGNSTTNASPSQVSKKIIGLNKTNSSSNGSNSLRRRLQRRYAMKSKFGPSMTVAREEGAKVEGKIERLQMLKEVVNGTIDTLMDTAKSEPFLTNKKVTAEKQKEKAKRERTKAKARKVEAAKKRVAVVATKAKAMTKAKVEATKAKMKRELNSFEKKHQDFREKRNLKRQEEIEQLQSAEEQKREESSKIVRGFNMGIEYIRIPENNLTEKEKKIKAEEFIEGRRKLKPSDSPGGIRKNKDEVLSMLKKVVVIGP